MLNFYLYYSKPIFLIARLTFCLLDLLINRRKKHRTLLCYNVYSCRDSTKRYLSLVYITFHCLDYSYPG
ncbi:hypothetical protein A1OE_1088 [Candidatus Endolissoclinum faulkneri L2]|uniref:Uncharacterized protein n=1 Tax=Candidatus Endolissoclinum faulkneri L2 TaxID=1193729 RepID=K7ZD75_9PROT|nr:hypothetical protein A1OE_1088 [Candidatus Endolissoclinum faulkneri L2]